jgi:chromosome partitioning protein
MAKIITIGQQKGGAGKTTISAHLAISLSQYRQKVACIDIDPQGSLKHWYELREDRFGKDYTGIDFLSIPGWRIDSAIRDLQNPGSFTENSDPNAAGGYDYIIIDAPPHTETETKSAIRLSDLIIVPMQATPTDLWATRSTMDFAMEEGKQAIIFLNRFNPLSKLSNEIISQIKHSKDNKYKYPIFKSFLGNRVAFSSCFLNGLTVTESQPKSQSAEEIRNLTKEVINILYPNSKNRVSKAGVTGKDKQKDRKIKE